MCLPANPAVSPQQSPWSAACRRLLRLTSLASLTLQCGLPPLGAAVADPNIDTPPVSQTVAPGANVTLTVVASGTPTLTYQWSKNGLPIPSATTATLSFPSAQAAAAGAYSVLVSNGLGTASAAATVAVSSDSFSGRTLLAGSALTTRATNVGASKEVGEPLHAGNAGGASVWWTWTAPVTGVFTVDTIGSGFNTLLSVYTGTAVGALTLVGADDDGAAYGCSKLSFNAVAGTTYQLAVDGSGGASGTILLNLQAAYAITTFAGSGSYAHVDGTGTSASFRQPAGIALDGAGNLYVTDLDAFTIRKITPAGVVSTFAGQAGVISTSQDGTGTGARFAQPVGIAADAAGNLYVVEHGNGAPGALRKITPGGVVTTLASGFSQPWGVAVDASGNIFVSDSGNSTIKKVTPAGGVTTFAGIHGVSGDTDGPLGVATFMGPTALAIDGGGNLYVATGSQTIRKITTGGVVSTFAGLAPNYGAADGMGSAARFDGPYGLAFDLAGNLFVTERRVGEIAGRTLRRITPAGLVTTVAGTSGFAGSADGLGTAAQFRAPMGIAVDPAGNLYVSDLIDRRIRKGIPALAPTIQTQPAAQTVAVGGTATFTVGATSGLPITYQWKKGGTDLPGATTATLVLNDVQGVDSAGYSVVVGNVAGNITSGVANLTVPLLAPVIVTHPLDQTVSTGASATFTVVAKGNPAPSYLWHRNGTPLAGATGATLVVPNVAAGDLGNYTVVVSNTSGPAATSNPAVLSVFVVPTVTAISANPITAGTTVTLTGTGFVGATAVKFNGLAAAFTVVSGTTITATVPLGVAAGAVTVVGPAGTSAATTLFTTTATSISQTLYVATGAGGASGKLYVVNPLNATATLVGNIVSGESELSVTGLAFHPQTGVLYGVTGNESGPTRRLVTINPATAQATLVGTLNVAGATTGSTDISFDVNGKLYTWRTRGGPLGTVNLTTAAITPIGSSTNGSGGNGLAFTPDGSLYVAGPASGPLLKVDPITGAATTVATLSGAPLSFDTINAMASDAAGQLYAVSSDFPANLIRINPATGAISTVGVLPMDDVDAIAFRIAPTVATVPPTVVSVSPAGVTIGEPVVIQGINFGGATAVRFNGVNATSFTVDSTTQITAVVPPGVSTGTFSVTTPAGTGTSTAVFTLLDRSLLNLLSQIAVPASGSVSASFTVQGGNKNILIRGVGPSLSNPTGRLADPRLTLLNGALATIGANDDWGTPQSVAGGPVPANATAITAAIAAVTASPGFTAGSKDAAILVNLPPGTYTAVLEGVGGSGGQAQFEVVDADTGLWPRVSMLALRGAVSGEKHLIAGFNLTGTAPRKILMRVLGESLGVNYDGNNGVLIDPVVSLHQGPAELESNDDSDSDVEIDAATLAVGAQKRYGEDEDDDGSLDSTIFRELSPGSYTLDVRPYSPPGQFGQALVEIFDVLGHHPTGLPPAITWLSPNQTGTLLGDAVFGVVTVAKPAATFQWRRYEGGVPVPISGATKSMLRLTGLQMTDQGRSYDVVITSGSHTITSPVRTVSITSTTHSADTNMDFRINLSELTRVIQLYNHTVSGVRTGAYHTAAGTEDGFAPGSGSITRYHSADTNQDGMLSATELSRVILLYNYVSGSQRTGEYHVQTGTEDGFAPGPNVVPTDE